MTNKNVSSSDLWIAAFLVPCFIYFNHSLGQVWIALAVVAFIVAPLIYLLRWYFSIH